jgi:DNA-binding XRE family transcriptional regulator
LKDAALFEPFSCHSHYNLNIYLYYQYYLKLVLTYIYTNDEGVPNVPFSALNDQTLAKELGRRIQAIRLSVNLTQAELAAKSGLSTPSLSHLEDGKGAQLSTLLRVLRALNRLDDLELAFPEARPSPLALLKMQGKVRLRASGKRKKRG